MRIDLHCHSKCSKRPNLWIMQKIGCPESFTEPLALYEAALRKGMDRVTITDHNVIDGALEIAHLPKAFMGCEYTTYFPDDRCKVHVLVYGQTEAQHDELDKARENIHDFVSCLDQHALPRVCAHPLFWVNDRLSLDHVEKLTLLFKNWEINGDMAPEMNANIRRLLQTLTPRVMEQLAEKHGIEPRFPKPHIKNLTGGSDDHSFLHLASTYTEVAEAEDLDAFWEGVEQGSACVETTPASPARFARNIYSTAYQFYKSKLDLERHTNRNILLKFLDQTLQAQPVGPATQPSWYHILHVRRRLAKQRDFSKHSAVEFARLEAERHILHDPALMQIVREGYGQEADLDRCWFDFVTAFSSKVLVKLGAHILERVVKAGIVDVFHSIGTAGALYTMLAPYLVSYSLHQRQRTWSEESAAHFAQLSGTKPTPRESRIAHFTDTFDEVNGVAMTLQQKLTVARDLGKDYDIICCEGAGEKAPQPGVWRFEPVGSVVLPEYEELQLPAPPFLTMLRHCFERNYTHLHAATPGPVGLAALGIARILQLPISGTYHTAIPEYGKTLTEDAYVEEALWRFMVWFYEQMDTIYVPSHATAQDLLDRGIDPAKIRVYPRGCDVVRFSPDKEDGILEQEYGIGHEHIRFLYVGRVSKEKNLDVLSSAFQRLVENGAPIQLIVAGDGPYMSEMQRQLKGMPATFLGYTHGERLSAVYASSDCLVFPSTTDTFGNVILEAQASGIPVIVTDKGGPCENIIRGETGLVVRGGDVTALQTAMWTLTEDRERLQSMGAAARRYMESRDFQTAFEELIAMYENELPRKGRRATSVAV
ncbi:MAG: glycosyltransferase [Candidatus Hydrogenedentota bacterium]